MIGQTIIAANNFGAGQLLENAAAGANLVADGFSQLWEQTLAGGLYKSLCSVGTLFAVGSLALFMVEWGKQMLNGEEQKAFTELIWPLIVAMLLSNNGTVLASSTLMLRGYINSVNTYVLEYTAADVDLRAAYQQGIGQAAIEAAVGDAIQQCRSAQLSNQEQIECLKRSKEDLQAKFPNIFKGDKGEGIGGWVLGGLDKIDQAAQEADGGSNPVEGIANKLTAASSAAIGAVVTSFITSLLLALNNAYQWGLELALLLTALIGPLAVGGSLMPIGTKAIVGWLTGFFTVAIAKLSFNIILGLAGQLIATAKASQPMIFLAFIGIVAPFLATGIAAGGGIAVLTQLNKGAEWVGTGVATGGSVALSATINTVTSRITSKAANK
ncbi:hypothetical protein G7B40_025265 [Aetokthonos hydrillicola Thurmond2011]|jgi:hypothetical protein|uniref:NAD/NADP transhydrogenase beta subunit n=1 Tax=Aetokthonos hydrillicola Thurmond2011 TaxID=2712845 RepID=A0AAP5IAD9_9CYAN|nr:hypothetical protein [Aetokthonos hydrillicola]MBO3458432.1 hypothetical protein [Aetokthonos hydrillicola CCALA 1050]MBW4586241.1 hypothetical protein [Aetokthonos hydrillicola CCALA 1050]MDR9897848.1 hypothetical protein [Aetokthonos hydrillicola Thurmond2011]